MQNAAISINFCIEAWKVVSIKMRLDLRWGEIFECEIKIDDLHNFCTLTIDAWLLYFPKSCSIRSNFQYPNPKKTQIFVKMELLDKLVI